MTAAALSLFLPTIGSWLMTLSASLLSIAGSIMNVTITMTLHIKQFVAANSGVYAIWLTIRDLSGIFIIFLLLYAGFKIILSLESKVSDLIKNIVIVGLLINFSFFITGVLIDASNIVSLTLYHAISPSADSVEAKCPDASTFCITKASFNDGGISNRFMDSLQVTKFYNPGLWDSFKNNFNGKNQMILIISIAGSVIMLTTAMGFLLASIAFIYRFILLVCILAFSPIWFASFVIPGLSGIGKKWWDALQSQLLFMPVYLLLLYAALKVLIAMNLPRGVPAALDSMPALLGMIVNYVFVALILNLPLLAAVKLGGMASSWIDMKKFGNQALFKWAGSRASGYVATRTVGAAASKIDKSIGNTTWGNSILGRDIRKSTVGALAESKMGASRSFVERKKEQKDVDKKNAEIGRKSIYKDALVTATAGATPNSHVPLKDVMGKMSQKERLSLGKDLTNFNVIRHLSRNDIEALKKSEDISDEDKTKFFDARNDLLQTAAASGNQDLIKDIIKGYTGEELLNLDHTLLANDNIVANYTQGQLKTMADNGAPSTLKGAVGAATERLIKSGTRVSAGAWIMKQRNHKDPLSRDWV